MTDNEGAKDGDSNISFIDWSSHPCDDGIQSLVNFTTVIAPGYHFDKIFCFINLGTV